MNKALKSLGIFVVFAATIAMAADGLVFKQPAKKKGDVVKHTLKANLNVMNMEAVVTSTQVAKVIEVNDAGDYTVESSTENSKVVVGGQEMDQGVPSSIVVYDAKGEVKKFSGEPDADEYRYYRLLNWHAPEGEKKVGDKWTLDLPGDAKVGSVNVKGEYEFVAEEKVDDTDVIKIKFNVKETEGAEPAGHEGTIWLRKSDFEVFKASGKWNAVPIPKAGIAASGTYELNIVK